MNNKPFAVERTKLDVIERKLLAALEDPGTVAILASRKDLECIIEAMERYPWRDDHMSELSKGLKRLKAEAFPDNNPEPKANEKGS